MSYACECPCGTNKFSVNAEPLVRFYCHCTICQRMYDAPYVDITLFKLNDVDLPEDHSIEFGQYKKIMPVDRGLCQSCHKPVMARVGEGDKAFAFVSVRNNRESEQLPPPVMHVFYGTRAADVDDDLPKYSNGLTSRWAFLKYMF